MRKFSRNTFVELQLWNDRESLEFPSSSKSDKLFTFYSFFLFY